MILEAAVLKVRSGEEDAFEQAFRAASPLIASSPGYISHQLQRCVETKERYLLLVQWETMEAHSGSNSSTIITIHFPLLNTMKACLSLSGANSGQ
jgi:heme-degrading monooxygenase HmoA